MFNISIENSMLIDQLASSQERVVHETTNWLVDMSIWVKNDLKNRVPVKKGNLKNSVRYELQPHANGGGEATFHSVWYGQVLDEGSDPSKDPYVIKAKKKALVFEHGGEKVFAMTVQHKAIKPRNFTLETLNAALTEADKQADDLAERIFKGVVG
ncbi:hypothetical protein O9H85_08160 [Paenibacillus filicis]|uniref:HK97 gp10 family phage protein n=1 Tax=Paenibacillus gyeongsangnamensis TaxID=3388067 RepID=A0ABT4Q6I9_9BACL|nr:hypothetical protein [Paenibacillus filicis]MCZ8512406.1 hypothetical protein [Paenibacillus filicis]